jgi:hypothetical protein
VTLSNASVSVSRHWPAEIVHQGVQFFVAALREQGGDVALIAKVVHQAFAPRGTALIGQRRVVRIRTGLDPGLQRFAARLLEGGPLQAP